MKLMHRIASVSVITIFATTAAVRAEVINYYVGIDNLAVLASGTYAGLANPNHQRLTFLRFNNSEVTDPATSHYHSIGIYSYSGPVDGPIVQGTSANNRIPESYTGYSPLNLHPGTGAFAGKRISGVADASPQSTHRYDRLEIRSTHDLSTGAAGSIENYLYHSSSGRWNQPFGPSTQVALELTAITPGLHIATSTGTPVLESVGARHEIGRGDNWSFTPVFWTDLAAAHGEYSASFKFVDLSGARAESGEFHLDFFVPEPNAAAVIGAAGWLGLAFRRMRSPAC